MPKIIITEKDTTTAAATIAEEATVYVPVSGSAGAGADINGCQLFSKPDDYTGSDEYVKACLKAGLKVLAQSIGNTVANAPTLNPTFLKDKDTYDIKFITSGLYPTVYVNNSSTGNISSTALLSNLSTIAASRGDCALIASLDLNNASSKVVKDALDETSFDSSHAALFASNIKADISNEDTLASSYTINKSADLSYLIKFGDALRDGNQWESIAGVNRGRLSNFDESALISKYDLDNSVMTVTGLSFNGICKVRPNAIGTIWGDRTLLKNDGQDLKATSFLSIRNIISDIAKRAYNQAIIYTYETNNAITWANFKNALVDLLDQMLQAQVIANYSIEKVSTTKRATIACAIHISPYGPVENFDIDIIIDDQGLSINA